MRKFLTNPIKFTFLTLGAALIAALLRSLAIVLAFKGNYFTGSPLAIAQTVVTVVFAIALAVLPLTAAKPSTAPRAPKSHAVFTKLAAALTALCLFLCFISACVASGTLTLPVLLSLLAFPSLLAGIVYFVLHFFEKGVSLTVKTVFPPIGYADFWERVRIPSPTGISASEEEKYGTVTVVPSTRYAYSAAEAMPSPPRIVQHQ